MLLVRRKWTWLCLLCVDSDDADHMSVRIFISTSHMNVSAWERACDLEKGKRQSQKTATTTVIGFVDCEKEWAMKIADVGGLNCIHHTRTIMTTSTASIAPTNKRSSFHSSNPFSLSYSIFQHSRGFCVFPALYWFRVFEHIENIIVYIHNHTIAIYLKYIYIKMLLYTARELIVRWFHQTAKKERKNRKPFEKAKFVCCLFNS